MLNFHKHGVALGTLLTPLVLAACGGGITSNDFNSVQAENQRLRQQVASQQEHIDRLRGAIEYTVESDLLFPSGSYQMSSQGKALIGKFAQKLVPLQEDRIMVTGY